jgi:hypothetical protein
MVPAPDPKAKMTDTLQSIRTKNNSGFGSWLWLAAMCSGFVLCCSKPDIKQSKAGHQETAHSEQAPRESEILFSQLEKLESITPQDSQKRSIIFPADIKMRPGTGQLQDGAISASTMRPDLALAIMECFGNISDFLKTTVETGREKGGGKHTSTRTSISKNMIGGFMVHHNFYERDTWITDDGENQDPPDYQKKRHEYKISREAGGMVRAFWVYTKEIRDGKENDWEHNHIISEEGLTIRELFSELLKDKRWEFQIARRKLGSETMYTFHASFQTK